MSNHINQLVHLVKPEFPRVFTNFENQVGEYSVAYKRAEEDFIVVSKIEKNKFNYDLIVQYKSSGIYDIIHYHRGKNITEDYGYALDDCIPDAKQGQTFYKNDLLYKTSNYDEYGNFGYGVNLNAVFLPYKGLTYEDGIVISESAAKKMLSYKVEETIFSINNNDILLNLYGDEYSYKSFPQVGDEIKNNILVALRRKETSKTLFDFQLDNLKEIDNIEDTIIFTSGGTVVDIDIFCNIDMEKILKEKSILRSELFTLYLEQLEYYKKLAAELEKIIPVRKLTEDEIKKEVKSFTTTISHPILAGDNPNKYTEELAYMWKYAHEYINERIPWRFEGKSFDSFKIRFTILKENPLTVGAKLTGRYGNKGVVSFIAPDDEMPTTVDGRRAEVCLNPLGVLNRLNLA